MDLMLVLQRSDNGILACTRTSNINLDCAGQGMDARNRMWQNDMGFQGPSQGMHPNSKEGSVFYKTRLCNR